MLNELMVFVEQDNEAEYAVVCKGNETLRLTKKETELLAAILTRQTQSENNTCETDRPELVYDLSPEAIEKELYVLPGA